MLTRRQALAGLGTLPFAACVQTQSKTSALRAVRQIVRGTTTKDGAGVKLTRLLGGRDLAMLDPFLMLDEFHSRDPEDYQRGFPTHPHRGFETVSILLDGELTHKDSVGNTGTITKDGVQWMTAGRGILHSEMPRANAPGEDLWGYQLWVNLPAKLKMTAPRYQDLGASSIPVVQLDDGRARVLAGKIGQTKGAVEGVATAPTLLDVHLDAGARFRHRTPTGDNTFAYVVFGATTIGAEPVSRGSLAVFGVGDEIEIIASEKSRVLVFSGHPIGEPVARGGPFVMNTNAELQRAYEDYRAGRLTL